MFSPDTNPTFFQIPKRILISVNVFPASFFVNFNISEAKFVSARSCIQPDIEYLFHWYRDHQRNLYCLYRYICIYIFRFQWQDLKKEKSRDRDILLYHICGGFREVKAKENSHKQVLSRLKKCKEKSGRFIFVLLLFIPLLPILPFDQPVL